MQNEWNMNEDECSKLEKDCEKLRKNCQESRSIDNITPEEWNNMSKTFTGKLYHPNDHAIKKQVGGSHYNRYSIQPVDFILANKLDWCEANAIKYITRHKDKGGVEDIRKAIHYLEILLERMVNEHN